MKVEAALLHLRLKGMEKDEVGKDRSLQDQLQVPQPEAIEAPARKGKRRSLAARIGKPQAHASMGKSADFGIHQHASSTSKGTAKQEIPVHILIGLEELIHQRQTSLQRDLLSDCQCYANRNHQHMRGATLARITVKEKLTDMLRGATLALPEQKAFLTDALQGATLAR